MTSGAIAAGAQPAVGQCKRLAAAAVALGLSLDDAQLQRLLDFLQMLQRWNKVYNLTALRDPEQMLSHHLIDCLAMLPPLRCWVDRRQLGACRAWGVDSENRPQRGQFLPDLQPHSPAMGQKDGEKWTSAVDSQPTLPKPDRLLAHADAAMLTVMPRGPRLRLLDVGSGGGLPGVVLALVQADWQLSCVDTVAKKASFIKQVAVELRLPNLRGLHARVESLASPPPDRPGGAAGYDLITSRAFASLADFTRLSAHLLAPDGVWVAMKGRVPDDEQADLPSDIEVFHVEQLQVPGLDAQRCLVWMRRRQA